jgi:hypothetical protein
MLLVAGDNDTYPLWFAQHVLGVRSDVVVLTHPLIGAGWYREELHRRWQLGTGQGPWRGSAAEMAVLAASARDQARPLAAAVTVERAVRDRLTPHWRLEGLVYVESVDSIGRGVEGRPVTEPSIDRATAEVVAQRLEPLLRPTLRPAIDPTGRLMRAALHCPSHALRAGSDTTAARLLDSICNYR